MTKNKNRNLEEYTKIKYSSQYIKCIKKITNLDNNYQIINQNIFLLHFIII